MSESKDTKTEVGYTTLSGTRVDLSGDRSVTLFRDVRPDTDGIEFRTGETVTRVALSKEATEALTMLLTSDGPFWKVV